MTIIAWITAISVVFCYFLTAKTGKPGWFDWANILGCLILAPINYKLGAGFGSFLNLTFGGVALYSVMKRRPKKDTRWHLDSKGALTLQPNESQPLLP